jgi:hypothetical protein
VDGFDQDEAGAARATKEAKLRFVFSQRSAMRLKRLTQLEQLEVNGWRTLWNTVR